VHPLVGLGERVQGRGYSGSGKVDIGDECINTLFLSVKVDS
jgi:hypothetical protein